MRTKRKTCLKERDAVHSPLRTNRSSSQVSFKNNYTEREREKKKRTTKEEKNDIRIASSSFQRASNS